MNMLEYLVRKYTCYHNLNNFLIKFIDFFVTACIVHTRWSFDWFSLSVLSSSEGQRLSESSWSLSDDAFHRFHAVPRIWSVSTIRRTRAPPVAASRKERWLIVKWRTPPRPSHTWTFICKVRKASKIFWIHHEKYAQSIWIVESVQYSRLRLVLLTIKWIHRRVISRTKNHNAKNANIFKLAIHKYYLFYL